MKGRFGPDALQENKSIKNMLNKSTIGGIRMKESNKKEAKRVNYPQTPIKDLNEEERKEPCIEPVKQIIIDTKNLLEIFNLLSDLYGLCDEIPVNFKSTYSLLKRTLQNLGYSNLPEAKKPNIGYKCKDCGDIYFPGTDEHLCNDCIKKPEYKEYTNHREQLKAKHTPACPYCDKAMVKVSIECHDGSGTIKGWICHCK